MAKQYVFFYFMKKDDPTIPEIVPGHMAYWKKENPVGFSGGPFADHSGGMILFEAENTIAANEVAMNDPFVINNVLEKKWLKEWGPQK